VFTKFDHALMHQAYIWANLSSAVRKKVGAVLARGTQPLMSSYNGLYAGSPDNKCEDEEGKTKSTVLHAEENIISLCAKHGIKTEGATLYITCKPCDGCASKIIQAGISKVIYHEDYQSSSKGSSEGSDAFKLKGIELIKFEEFSLGN
jgi:dCMP deaminase